MCRPCSGEPGRGDRRSEIDSSDGTPIRLGYDPGLGGTHAFLRVRPSARPVHAAVEEVLRSEGQPLEPTLRASMESKFRYSFSRVRVHADRPAETSAAAVQARAYTLGPHIAFARGAYDPTSEAGAQLVAHELEHVVQQSRSHGSSSESEAEREAAQIADAAAAGRHVAPVRATQVRIARQTSTALAERELEVEAVEVSGRSYVLYENEVRTAGSSSWLANNPGNMDYTPDLVEWGAYEGKKLKWASTGSRSSRTRKPASARCSASSASIRAGVTSR
jgi:hypothetical protein